MLQTQYAVGGERFIPSSFRIIAKLLKVEIKVTASGRDHSYCSLLGVIEHYLSEDVQQDVGNWELAYKMEKLWILGDTSARGIVTAAA